MKVLKKIMMAVLPAATLLLVVDRSNGQSLDPPGYASISNYGAGNISISTSSPHSIHIDGLSSGSTGSLKVYTSEGRYSGYYTGMISNGVLYVRYSYRDPWQQYIIEAWPGGTPWISITNSRGEYTVNCRINFQWYD